ncbi:2-oxoacid:acceptor oxidoreductase subunit alpha [Candidatus Bipolaricaulota sp. J31]
MDERVLIQGNEAVARGAIHAGCRFFAGYPITPSSEIMHCMARTLPEVGGVFFQAEDEIAALAACVGASWAGFKSMTATSGPGFSLMQEEIGYAVMTETPVVIVDVQRAGPSTGQATKPAQGDYLQARFGSHGDYELVVLSAWSVEEAYRETVRAFNIAEELRCPVVLLLDEAVGHLREDAALMPLPVTERRKGPLGGRYFGPTPEGVAPMPPFGSGARLHVTGSTHDPTGRRMTQNPQVQGEVVAWLSEKVLGRREELFRYEAWDLDDAELVLVSWGISARAARAAQLQLRQQGYPVGLFRPITLWPLAPAVLTEVLGNREVLVVEMNRGQLAHELSAMLGPERIRTLTVTEGRVISPGRVAEAALAALEGRG